MQLARDEMKSTDSSFEALPPLLFVILLVCVIIWFVLVTRLFRLLRTRHPDVYDSLGRPTLILNNSIRNSWLFTRFLLGGHFEAIDDGETLRLCQFMRVFAFCYLAFFIAIVVFSFAFAPAHSSP
jgi:hypothetical protein